MWPWSEKRSKEAEDRLGTLSRRLDDCESRLRTLPAEWQDTLDRIEHILARLNKRAQRAQVAASEQETEQEAAPVSEFDREMALRRGRRQFLGSNGE